MAAAADSWSSGEVRVGSRRYAIHRLAAVEEQGLGSLARLPRSIRVLLENLLRHEDGRSVTREDIRALAQWSPSGEEPREIAFRPARVLLQDFTGVPAVVDLAVMRDAMAALGGDPSRINPLRPADLVIDHSVQIDFSGSTDALARNRELDYERNLERYAFLRWGQQAFRNFRVAPPGAGICHQVNLEYLAPVVFREEQDGDWIAFPDTVVGTDSHTTMINGLGVIGWGVGGIEAEACLLGQPIAMKIPEVVGFRLRGALPAGSTATDLVLRVTEMLRKHGVVEKFVEFFGPGLRALSLPDRATVANMAPEYGATVGFFPIDEKTLDYMRLTGRDEDQVQLVEAYARAQGLFALPGDPEPEYSSLLELDLGEVGPSVAGPRRPQDRASLAEVPAGFEAALGEMAATGAPLTPEQRRKRIAVTVGGEKFEIGHGSIVIAAITSCTNTSNPSVLMAAGLLAKKAIERGLRSQPWVKTSLAPGSQVVQDYLERAGLLPFLEKMRFHIVAYGCTTCIGNSGPLADPIEAAIDEGKLVVAAVLSGNRNFEGRIHAKVRGNYLMSPPLVVAYAIAGRMDLNLEREPLGTDRDGKPVFLRDIWPAPEEVQRAVEGSVKPEMFKRRYGRVFEGDEAWQAMQVSKGQRYAWSDDSTYVRKPPYFDDLTLAPAPLRDLIGARVLALLGDSVTTDHISPASPIQAKSPAGEYLAQQGVSRADFNTYGARRGNHEVMMRGTFANVRLRNKLAPGTEGGFTKLLPDGTVTTIFDASQRYLERGVPLVVIAGKEYGTGSSRDWAAKGPALLGVRACIVESFERIHRSNLIGMGILPLQFLAGESAQTHKLTGEEIFSVRGIAAGLEPGCQLTVTAQGTDGRERSFQALLRIDTAEELEYYRSGGILHHVLRQLARS